jgi:polygalacturonase
MTRLYLLDATRHCLLRCTRRSFTEASFSSMKFRFSAALMWLACAGLVRAGTPALPIIPAYLTNVAQAPYNAVGDDSTDNTVPIQSAINDVNSHGGGTVEIPGPGVYLSGPLTMKNKINLQIDAGATLRMLPYGTWPGTTPLLTFSSVGNVEISGSGGIDGQGAAWWTNNPGSGLSMIFFSNCKTVLVQNVTVSNAPAQQIVFKNKNSNITIQGVTIRAPSSHAASPSHNTDGIDLVGTNCLVQNCVISTGDDNIALGSSSIGAIASDILVTNCAFGDGHGMTIGGNTAGGVSNLTVINCTFNATDYGIRMKSDNASSSPGSGGVAENLFYFNLSMTNIRYEPILIYSYYNESAFSTPVGISPATAAAQPVASATTNTPLWCNIVISNLAATVGSLGQAGLIWGRTELPATNITLSKINITAPADFDLYNASAIQFVDSQIAVPGGGTFSLYNARLVVSNTVPGTNVVSLDGLASANALALHDAQAVMNDSGALGANPIILDAATLTNTTSLTLPGSVAVDFVLGSNPAAIGVSGNLNLDATLNVTNGIGFAAGTYTLFTYSGTFEGSPVLGAQAGGYNFTLSTNVPHQVNLIVSSTNASPPSFGNIAVSGASVILSGTGGPSNAVYVVLASTNVALPVYEWTPIATNHFDSAGVFSFTNSPLPGSPRTFYLLRTP